MHTGSMDSLLWQQRLNLFSKPHFQPTYSLNLIQHLWNKVIFFFFLLHVLELCLTQYFDTRSTEAYSSAIQHLYRCYCMYIIRYTRILIFDTILLKENDTSFDTTTKWEKGTHTTHTNAVVLMLISVQPLFENLIVDLVFNSFGTSDTIECGCPIVSMSGINTTLVHNDDILVLAGVK